MRTSSRLVVVLGVVCFALTFLSAQEAVALGECDCEMTATNMTISRGTNLEFDVTITNNTANAGSVDFGTKITMPDATTTGWVFGPINVSLTAYGEQSGHITYSVPSSGPVGRYTYHSYVGVGGSLFGECEFDFIVPADVPKTGQTTSYATGDDGDLQMGASWPVPRFTDNGDGTVTDNMTGLIWLKDADCFGARFWADALSDCNGLASGSCGLTDGSVVGDWRLPNLFELESLLDLTRYAPAIDTSYFPGTLSSYYWSSTSRALTTGEAWVVHFYAGSVGYGNKLSAYDVRAVRGGQ